MANENFYIKSFDNIFVIDPNKLINSNGFPEERNIAQENLVMYANLECNVQPRSRLLSGQNKQTLKNESIASVNFLRPNNQNSLTTNWTNLQSEGADPNVINSELLGITNITYRCGASFTPTVTVTLEDVRGRALFESGNDSVYSVFLNLPYPTFYLTMKGYYGKAVRYTLILQKFNASFDQSSGNFISTLNFVGYKYNILTDLQQSFLFGLPYMYSQQVNTNIQTEPTTPEQNSADQLNGNNTDITSVIEKRGYQTIKSVYELYKTKKIVDEKFPTLTIDQLVSRLQNFEKNILENYGEVDVAKLTDGDAFRGLLSDYLAEIFSGVSPKSFVKKFLNEKKYFVVIGRDGKPAKVYTYIDEIIKSGDYKKYDEVLSNLNSLITKHNEIIRNAATFGEKAGKREDIIPVNIKESNMIPNPFLLPNVGYIDLAETAKARFGKAFPTSAELQSIRTELQNLDAVRNSVVQNRNDDETVDVTKKEVPFFFRFDGEGFFRDEIFKIEKALNAKLKAIEENITTELNNLLKSNQGIGFEPTIRNVLAVILASTDAFLRLMDSVHEKAFDARNDARKKSAAGDDVKNDPDSPVFPWPLFAKEIPVDGETKFELKYPGDPDYLFETGAFDYNVWPEVEFVEEFQKGYLERQQDALQPTPQSNESEIINRLLISAFDEASNRSYSDLQKIPFLIEIYERIRTIAMYQGFERNQKYEQILNFVQSFEASNIKIAIGKDSSELIDFLKEFGFGQQGAIVEYERYLNESAPKAFFVVSAGTIYTPYLKGEIESNFKFIEKELPEINASIATENNAGEVEQTMTKYLQSSDKNELYFTDILPFVVPDWNKENLSNGTENFELNKVLNTTKSLFYNTKLKKILNYASDYTLNNKGENNKNRPFNFFVNTGLNIEYTTAAQDMVTYLKNRAKSNGSEKKSFYTEGRLDDINPETGVGINGRIGEQTSSMLNTPQFIKAIQEGVAADRAGSSNPYVQASYLFLNSLPLANLKRQYIDSDDSTKDYIGPTFRKFGALHSVPKMWACKLGSIWYRYKNFVESGTDFLDSLLGPFDQTSNYDPNTFSPTTNYFFTAHTTTGITITLTNVVTVPQTASPPLYNDIMNVGFYPVVLNDFYYFYNGENLYDDDTEIQTQIQEKITNKDVMILSNGNSSFYREANYDPSRPEHYITFSTISILFKNKLKSNPDDTSTYFYSAPSFGSRFSQVISECFNQSTLQYPVFENQNIYNGSVRLFWGGTHFGYFPTINQISEPDEYLSRSELNSWPFHFILDDIGENITFDKIEDLFGTFTREELDLFENEFLNFSRSEQQSTTDFNIQTILKNALKVEQSLFDNTDQNILIENFQKNQLLNFNGVINNYINLNVIYQKGNPTNFDYRTFSYFTNNPLYDIAGSADQYTTTTPNALPTSALTITLADSQTDYEDAWLSLFLNVGFSTIPAATFTDTGSTITDFFVDNNIAFTEENIERFASLIKIYATKKTLNPNYNNTLFVEDVTTHIENTLELRNILFQGVFAKIQRVLQTSSSETEKLDNSKTQGTLTKLEYYNLFKALNDKWVAGNNYKDETMFEDILLLDRANRDIGNKVIVDIFSLISLLKTPKASVYNIVSSILQTNHFVIYNMPTYINFYGCQNVDDVPEKQAQDDKSFANSLFGTYTEVDYQNSKTKMVCQYVEQPSEQTNNPNIRNGYKDDSWDFEQSPKNPLVESKNAKEDFGLSNKAVGFNVDFGVQNQGVFTNVQVGQEMGKPTSESLQMEYELANLSRGTNTSSQNVSLIELYKTRSYSSTVTAMGNAMIQPTMYFVLRNIPLFAGPYLITEVNHVITAADFKTTMVGTRQKVNTPPIKNPLIETIRQNFVTKLKNDLKTKRQAQKVASNTLDTKNKIASNISSQETPSPNSICKVNDAYSNYTSINAKEDTTATRDMLQAVSSRIRTLNGGSNSGDTMNYVVTTLFYIESFNGQSFKYFNNNPAQIPIGSGTTAWGGELATLFTDEYICLNDSQNNSQAYAVFSSLDNSIDFNFSKYYRTFSANLLEINNENAFVSGFTKTWVEKFPQDNTIGTSDIYQNFIISYPDELNKLQEKVRASYKLVRGYLSTI